MAVLDAHFYACVAAACWFCANGRASASNLYVPALILVVGIERFVAVQYGEDEESRSADKRDYG